MRSEKPPAWDWEGIGGAQSVRIHETLVRLSRAASQTVKGPVRAPCVLEEVVRILSVSPLLLFELLWFGRAALVVALAEQPSVLAFSRVSRPSVFFFLLSLPVFVS